VPEDLEPEHPVENRNCRSAILNVLLSTAKLSKDYAKILKKWSKLNDLVPGQVSAASSFAATRDLSDLPPGSRYSPRPSRDIAASPDLVRLYNDALFAFQATAFDIHRAAVAKSLVSATAARTNWRADSLVHFDHVISVMMDDGVISPNMRDLLLVDISRILDRVICTQNTLLAVQSVHSLTSHSSSAPTRPESDPVGPSSSSSPPAHAHNVQFATADLHTYVSNLVDERLKMLQPLSGGSATTSSSRGGRLASKGRRRRKRAKGA
jgi:hypothetical protein